MKIRVVGHLKQRTDGSFGASWDVGFKRCNDIPMGPTYDPDRSEPVSILVNPDSLEGIWGFRRSVVRVEGCRGIPEKDVVLKIKHAVLREEKGVDRMRRGVEALQSLGRAETARRKRIPDSVRQFVWQRDQGKCVVCGSNEKLEFDHIIPVVRGGGDTERNIQLLCESCNRSKGSTI